MIMNNTFLDVFIQDFYFAAVSVFLVWLYITIHLRSVFLGSMSMINIIQSLPLTIVVYKRIFQVGFYHFLENLVVFVVLGVAADNVFVFTDAWKQSAKEEPIKDDLVKRMSYTWKRAAKAMLVTSSTTAFAFLASSFSKLVTIKAFGIFAAVIIPINYILVITIYPALVIVQEKYINRCWNRIKCWGKKKSENIKDDEMEERPESEEKQRQQKEK